MTTNNIQHPNIGLQCILYCANWLMSHSIICLSITQYQLVFELDIGTHILHTNSWHIVGIYAEVCKYEECFGCSHLFCYCLRVTDSSSWDIRHMQDCVFPGKYSSKMPGYESHSYI